MLNNIKSVYFIRMIFSYIDERKKLEIIKFNKYIQNILNINLINYKIFSGRYIVLGKNGKGKEYNNNDDLIFEGEYLNGKRNGKGKEYYDNGALRFEGEYLNGLKNGKGKEYDYDGKLEFEGEYLNGELF